jgi:hypothetical protein
MLDKIVNGYTIIAQEFVPGHGYIILGHRTNGPLSHEYVSARMKSMEDTYWFGGHYTSSLTHAVESYRQRAELM